MDSQTNISRLKQNEVGIIVADRAGDIIDLNDKAADMFRYDRSELIGTCSYGLLYESDMDNVKRFGKLFDGNVHTWKDKIQLGDGSIARLVAQCEKENGHLVSEIQEVNVLKDRDSPASKQIGEGSFDDLTARELQEITQNIRVDAPDGKIPLNAIMFDLMVDHNEIEQVKKGALSLHEACDERLAEEQETNPDSPEADVIREISESAFGLYLRIQRGDAELQGERDGKYSGYWNS